MNMALGLNNGCFIKSNNNRLKFNIYGDIRKGERLIKIQIYQRPDRSIVSEILNTLSLDRNNSPFLSKAWLLAWIDTAKEDISVIVFFRNDSPIGITTISRPVYKFAEIFNETLLNQTGRKQKDQVWIEYNDILCEYVHFDTCASALLNHVFLNTKSFRLYISMLHDSEKWIAYARKNKLKIECQTVFGYRNNIGGVENTNDLINKFSSNTRSKLKRSLKLMHGLFGELKIEMADATNFAAFYKELGKLHKKKWQQSEYGSGFDNPHFNKLHFYLNNNNAQAIKLLRFSAGSKLVGYSLYLIKNQTVFFYCAGISENDTHKHMKYGYNMHLEAMVFFSKIGFTSYDFMGGDAQYKTSLSSHIYEFQNLSIYNPNKTSNIIFYIKQALKRLRNLF